MMQPINQNLRRCLMVAGIAVLTTGCMEQGEPMIPADVTMRAEQALTKHDVGTNSVIEQPFHETVVGHWVGTCDIVAPGSSDTLFAVGMERIVEPTNDPNRYTWTIIYRLPDFNNVRNYSLVVMDEEAGYYQVDEHNGAFIDVFYYTPGIMTSMFEVGSARVIGHETFNGNTLNLQFLTTDVEPLTISGDENITVRSYPFVSNQICQLTRKSPI